MSARQINTFDEFIESEAILDNFTPWKNKNKIETIFQKNPQRKYDRKNHDPALKYQLRLIAFV